MHIFQIKINFSVNKCMRKKNPIKIVMFMNFENEFLQRQSIAHI